MSKAGPLTRSRSKQLEPVQIKQPNDRPLIARGQPFEFNCKTSPTFEEDSGGLYSGEIIIGLALGSPGQSPLPPLPRDHEEGDVSRQTDISGNGTCSETAAHALNSIRRGDNVLPRVERKGSSKWRKFGTLFAKKELPTQLEEPPKFYQLDRTPEQRPPEQRTMQFREDTTFLRRKRADSSRSNKIRVSPPPARFEGTAKHLPRRKSSRRKALRKQDFGQRPQSPSYLGEFAPQTELRSLCLPLNGSNKQPCNALLKVEIPNVELERYSIMFGDVLDVKSPPRLQSSFSASKQRQTTDVASRNEVQADIELSCSDLAKPPRQRSDSESSKSARSASFSLFPAPTRLSGNSAMSGGNKPTLVPSPLGRSVTAPSKSPVTNRPGVQRSKTQVSGQDPALAHHPPVIHVTPVSHGAGVGSFESQISCNSTLETPCGQTQTSIAYNQSTPELNYEAVSANKRRDVQSHQAFPTRKSSLKRVPADSNPATDRVRDDAASVAAAEVSIARQISISRRQRQLLVPVAPRLAHQPMTPTVVNGESTPAARRPQQLKSEGKPSKAQGTSMYKMTVQ